jgi:hypothetical protein
LHLGEINDSQFQVSPGFAPTDRPLMKAASGTASWRCFLPIARFRHALMVTACRCGSTQWNCTGALAGVSAL